MRVGVGRSACFAEELIGLTFVDVMTLEMVVRIVNRQVQLNDTVASELQRIDIDTAFP